MVMVEFFCQKHKALERYSIKVIKKNNVSPRAKIPRFHPNGDLKCVIIGKAVGFNEILRDVRKYFQANSIKFLNIKFER
jgi:hypothetical protein